MTDATPDADGPQGTVFEVRDLRKTYVMGEVEVQALRGVDLDIADGELLVILGHSGSGKSTLLNILGGLDVASSGAVRYRGRELTGADEAELTQFRRHEVGFIFQFFNLVPSLTARENVQLVTDLVEDPMSAEEALDLVELGDRMDHFPSQLSGGQQQRVAVARAVAKRPAVLLCDEPTGALDIETGMVVLETLLRVNEKLGTTELLITHNAVIADMADRMVRLTDGRVAEEERIGRRREPREIEW